MAMFDDKGMFDVWFPNPKCKHNEWDITVGIPICTHPFVITAGTVFIGFCVNDNPFKPFFCPLALEKEGKVKSMEEFIIWWKKAQSTLRF